MPYVDYQYYCDVYMGEPVEETDFPRLCLRASDMVEQLTVYNLSVSTFAKLPEQMQDFVKKAVCAQIEYIDANGQSELYTINGIQSAGLGKFSYTTGGAMGDLTGGTRYAPLAVSYLAPTGLLYRGGRI